ncbi:sensor histidine kinase [Sandaracinus amylolyticus]|uniref:histidine kinase n=1 Tax=Sandaracinus amylolyticus TaxID=927083 RepID=A0A0F6W303_9BACT|nr:HAMP domain-containing sensor histidine kinase [Sandaracinus amylolyticus]AKF06015.1 Phosphate regulon sensor protein PhoR [Sandaracinus amylolyticus]
MEWRSRLVYLALIPAIAIAAGILGYFSIQSARQFARESEQSVLASTLVLVDEKVDRVEQMIITSDEAVFHLVDLERPEAVSETWQPLAERISPSVRALLVLDDGGEVIGYACRCSTQERRDFLKVFTERILPNLELERERIGVLRHHHRTYADTSYLISYRAVRHAGRRHYMVAHHDTGFIEREVFPTLFVHEEERVSYNVVDDDNRLVYGQSRIARAGDYLVGRRFPTTLYGWRLQIAPKRAPELIVRGAEQVYTESALIGLSFAIVLLGVGFLIYAAVKESRLNALRSEFIANVSHELKTPLSVVRMFSEMLMTGRVRDEKKREQYLQIIARESERLTALIDNVLDFSAIERGKQTYQMREGDLADVVARAIDTFRYRLERENLEVKLEVVGEVPAVRFDEQAILLAVMNLLDNAMKYGAGSTIEVTIERGRRHAYVRVRDHGPGIPDEHHKRVFERFYRVRNGSSSARGSGIGLSLVKRIVEAHRGRAWVENAAGGGARVSFSLPFSDLAGGGTAVALSSWRNDAGPPPDDEIAER